MEFDGRRRPLVKGVPSAHRGVTPGDDGLLTNLSGDEASALIKEMPELWRSLYQWISREGLGSAEKRWSFFFDTDPRHAGSSAELDRRIEGVRRFRLSSTSAKERAACVEPWRLHRAKRPAWSSLVVASSFPGACTYVPAGIYDGEALSDEQLLVINGGSLALAGIVLSKAFRLWVSDASNDTAESSHEVAPAYWHFPFPELDDATEAAIKEATRGVLLARINFTRGTLDDLYQMGAMPLQLQRAHHQLDAVVMAALGLAGETDAEALLSKLHADHAELLAAVAA
jgi:hypothetical protein